MNWDFVIKIAVFTVGITGMLNKLFSVENAKLKIAMTVTVGFIGYAVMTFINEYVFMTLIGISVAVVFYDSVLKMIERILKGSEQ